VSFAWACPSSPNNLEVFSEIIDVSTGGRSLGSHRLLTPAGRRHWPFQSGYLESSNAWAAAIVKVLPLGLFFDGRTVRPLICSGS
jgi:hypothetical protein